MADESSHDNRGEIIGRLKAVLKQTVGKLKAAEDRAKALETEATTARNEAATAKGQYDQSKLKAENDQLRGELRTSKHRQVFNRLARERGAPDETHDLLWQSSGWKAEGDEVNEQAMANLLDGLKAKPGVSRLFGEAESQEGQRRAPGGGQGGHDSRPNGKLRVTQEMIQSGSQWLRDNRAEFNKAVAENRLEITP
jgi:hypothetical protein